MYALRLQTNKREGVKINDWGHNLIQNISNRLGYNLNERGVVNLKKIFEKHHSHVGCLYFLK